MTTSYPLRLTNTLPLANLNRLWEMVSNYPEELQSELSALLTHFQALKN